MIHWCILVWWCVPIMQQYNNMHNHEYIYNLVSDWAWCSFLSVLCWNGAHYSYCLTCVLGCIGSSAIHFNFSVSVAASCCCVSVDRFRFGGRLFRLDLGASGGIRSLPGCRNSGPLLLREVGHVWYGLEWLSSSGRCSRGKDCIMQYSWSLILLTASNTCCCIVICIPSSFLISRISFLSSWTSSLTSLICLMAEFSLNCVL